MPQKIISVTRRFHDDMRACTKLDGGGCSQWSPFQRGRRQRCMFAPLLLNIFLESMDGAFKRFETYKSTMDTVVGLRKKVETGGWRVVTAGKSAPVTSRCRIHSQSPEQLREVLLVFLDVSTAFDLTVLEAKPEVMYLCTRGCRMSLSDSSIEGVGQVYTRTHGFVCLKRNINISADPFTEVNQRIRNIWCSVQKYTLELHQRTSATSRVHYGCWKPKSPRKCCTAETWNLRTCHFDTPCWTHHNFFNTLHRMG